MPLNTWASINKAFEAQRVTFGVQAIYYEEMPPGAGVYPSLALTVLRQEPASRDYLGLRTPRSPQGGLGFLVVLECEVRTRSPSWAQAISIAEAVRAAFAEVTIPRQTWLLSDGTPNPSPYPEGWIRFSEPRWDEVQDPRDAQLKSIVLTFEVEWEKPL